MRSTFPRSPQLLKSPIEPGGPPIAGTPHEYTFMLRKHGNRRASKCVKRLYQVRVKSQAGQHGSTNIVMQQTSQGLCSTQFCSAPLSYHGHGTHPLPIEPDIEPQGALTHALPDMCNNVSGVRALKLLHPHVHWARSKCCVEGNLRAVRQQRLNEAFCAAEKA
jgi:hypothetical protein